MTQLLISGDLKIQPYHFQQALELAENRDHILDALLQSKHIDLEDALDRAVRWQCTEAITKVAPRLEKVPSETYTRAFTTNNPDVINAMLAHMGPTVENTVLMSPYEVWDTCKRGDISAIRSMVDRNVNLGEALVAITKLITYAKDNKLTPKADWYRLLEDIFLKNPPSTAVDQAVAIALINSQEILLKPLMTRMPDEAPRTKQVVELQLQSKYSQERHFQTAIELNNKRLVKLFIEGGMSIKPSHKEYARAHSCLESLSAMEENAP